MSSRRPSCLLETSFPESPALRVPGPWAAGEERGQGEGSGARGGSLSWGRVSAEGASPPPSRVAGTPAASPCFLSGADVHPHALTPEPGGRCCRGAGGVRASRGLGARPGARAAAAGTAAPARPLEQGTLPSRRSALRAQRLLPRLLSPLPRALGDEAARASSRWEGRPAAFRALLPGGSQPGRAEGARVAQSLEGQPRTQPYQVKTITKCKRNDYTHMYYYIHICIINKNMENRCLLENVLFYLLLCC